MRGYDAWLEAPYAARAADDEAFEGWIEAGYVDTSEMTDDEAWAAFEDYCEGEREQAEIDAAEMRAEMRAEDYWLDDRDYDY